MHPTHPTHARTGTVAEVALELCGAVLAGRLPAAADAAWVQAALLRGRDVYGVSVMGLQEHLRAANLDVSSCCSQSCSESLARAVARANALAPL